jgi:cytochrome c biogenesis protein CcmG, thiol:disulfide interchange protein DsbE
MAMNIRWHGPAALLLVAGLTAFADDFFPTLKVGSEVYSNVTITTVTATDLYFSHAQGMGNAKLKSLDSGLQRRFKFDAAKGREVEQRQAVETARYQMAVAAQAKAEKLQPAPDEEVPPLQTNDQGEPIAPKLYAKSFRGEPAPQVQIEKWITLAPALEGKFVLIEFWATWCNPCRRSISHLNELQEKFQDRLVVIGISDEPEAELRKLKDPQINYAIATDTAGRTRKAVEVVGIPHAMLIDPRGIVRFEGMPHYLTDAGLELLIKHYGQ